LLIHHLARLAPLQLLLLHLPLPANLLVHLVFPLEPGCALICPWAGKGSLFYRVAGGTLDHLP